MDTQLEVLSTQTDVYNESGTRLLYTIRPCPRSLIVARHPRSNRPFYTPWSKVLCKLCPQQVEIKMKDFQLHIARSHSCVILGEFLGAPDGSLWVTTLKIDPILHSTVNYKSYCSHDGMGLYAESTVITEPTHKSCKCLHCKRLYTLNEIKDHIKKTHGFDIPGSWKYVIDVFGNHVIDSRLLSDPFKTPFIQWKCENPEKNDTKEGFITVYDENGQRVYSIEPSDKLTFRNCRNELLYTSSTLCTCRLCEADDIPLNRYVLKDIQEHLLSEHQICLRNKYKREPGKIIFESTKRPTDLDDILDANRSIIYWDQKGIPVWWRMRNRIDGSPSHFCLRCEYKSTNKNQLSQHLMRSHNMYNSDKNCFVNAFGDFIHYFENLNALHIRTSSSSISQGPVKRPAADPNANIVDASLSKKRVIPQRTATHALPSTSSGLTASATKGSFQTPIGTASKPKFIITSQGLVRIGVASATQGSSKTSVSSSPHVLPQPVQRLPKSSETTITYVSSSPHVLPQPVQRLPKSSETTTTSVSSSSNVLPQPMQRLPKSSETTTTSVSSSSNVLSQPVQRLPKSSEKATTSSLPPNVVPEAQQVPTLPVLDFWSSNDDIYDSGADPEILTLTTVTQPAQIITAPLDTSPGTSSTQDIPTSSVMTTGQAALYPAPQGSVESQTPIETGPLKCIFCQQLIANCVCFGEENCTIGEENCTMGEKNCMICNQPESQCDCIG